MISKRVPNQNLLFAAAIRFRQDQRPNPGFKPGMMWRCITYSTIPYLFTIADKENDILNIIYNNIIDNITKAL